MKVFNKKTTVVKRKNLRKTQTDAEIKLWSRIRNGHLEGVKFFRQYGIGEYICDFYSPTVKLAIEVDGGQHYTEDGKGYDDIRTAGLEACGVKVIRFSNTEVLTQTNEVVERILEYIKT